ncbi:MAG: xanthine dehydrogenase family protein molybdopterin-binding subunit [Alphaproteobacteria bacterium]|nr:xanthine dehydrogenase family protein molybdopterin-binding subunit [Alphaproteobacteria bacterium]
MFIHDAIWSLPELDSGPATPENRLAVGTARRRLEDARLLAGKGAYLDDLPSADTLRGVIARSPYAHAKIARIDATAARAIPGVALILTAADLDADGIKPIPALSAVKIDGTPVKIAPPPFELLARDTVRHVGDPVAFVVAETETIAMEAVEALAIDYEELTPVLSPDDAAALPGYEIALGDAAAVDAAFAVAHKIVELEVINQRLAGVPLEPRNAQGEPDGERVTLRTGTQAPHLVRRVLTADVFGWPEKQLRVIAPDTGGGFGLKATVMREQGLAVWAAKKLGRKVRWISTRSEAFLSDTGGRDMRTRIAVAFDKDAKILALRAAVSANLGAYLSYFGPVPANIGLVGMIGVYATPAAHITSRARFTNTAPVDAYRGAGRPESIYAIERALDKAAREFGIGPDEIRRRNVVPFAALPYRTPMGTLYDSGDFKGTIDKLVAFADVAGFAARRKESETRGRLRGLGLGCYIERAAGGAEEAATVILDAEGGADVLLGTMTQGQGHVTAYTQIVADRLGLDPARIRIHQGDTDVVARGVGTFGSRSLPVGGSALQRAIDKVVEGLTPLAAELLEAAAVDIEFRDAGFRIAGTDRVIDVPRVAKAFHERRETGQRLPGGLGADLSAQGTFQPVEPTFPNGCHACEVEIDPDTGEVAVTRYSCVDDFGNEINPLLVDGQMHGALAQGIGQALLEHFVHDETTGQPLTGSFMDYAMPRAGDLPFFDLARNPDPCKNNPLGLKGCAEAGCIGAPPVVISAVLDALAPLGVKHIDMPATPYRVWKAIDDARQTKGSN